MQLVWDMFETALDLGDDAARYSRADDAAPGDMSRWCEYYKAAQRKARS